MHFPPPHRIPTASTQTTDWLLRNLSKTFRRSSVANATTQRLVFYGSCSHANAYDDFVRLENREETEQVIAQVNRELAQDGWQITDWSVEIEAMGPMINTGAPEILHYSGRMYQPRRRAWERTIETKDPRGYRRDLQAVGGHISVERMVIKMQYAD